MGFLRQEYWSGLPFPTPGDLPDPGVEPVSPALHADSSPLSHLVGGGGISSINVPQIKHSSKNTLRNSALLISHFNKVIHMHSGKVRERFFLETI